MPVKCDASISDDSAALVQNTIDGKPITLASCFLKNRGEQYIVKNLELLGTVWSID